MKRNSNENLALHTTGMEGTGEHFTINGQSAEDILQRESTAKFNNSVNEYVDKFDKHKQQLENYAKELSQDINGLEIMPMFNYVLVQPFEANPFQQIKMSKSGLYTDLGGMTPEYKLNETGEMQAAEQFIKVGTVIETGSKCEFIKPGDIVFYTIASECVVPFFKQGFVVVAEQRVLAVVNEKLTERKENARR